MLFASGQLINFEVAFIDQEGRAFSDENDAISSVNFYDMTDLSQGSIITGSETQSINGVMNFTQMYIRQEQNTTSLLRMSFTNLETYGNNITEILEPVPFEVYARLCEPGERYGADLSCEVCQKGYYLYEG